MEVLVLGGVLGVVAIVVAAWLYINRPKSVRVWHVGAVIAQKAELNGKQFMVYAFVKPVYGRRVRLVGYGGTMKGRSTMLPKQGSVLEGKLENA